MLIKRALITGANGGLGKECARQLALQDGIEKIYLGCRNPEKAKIAKLSLERSTGKSVFEIVQLDVANLDSVRAAVDKLPANIDALVMNAGGMGGQNFDARTENGVTQIFAVNVLGHVVLLEELLKSEKLTKVALYAGSEAARGVPKMGMKRPKLQTSSEEEFASICDGSFFGTKRKAMVEYGPVKYMAALWMASLAREYSHIRFITMSPGSTGGTDAMNDLPTAMKFMFKNVAPRVLPLFGLMHNLEDGAKRFVDGLSDDSYASGIFYGSRAPVLTGPVIDQGSLFKDLRDPTIQDNANKAIHRFVG